MTLFALSVFVLCLYYIITRFQWTEVLASLGEVRFVRSLGAVTAALSVYGLVRTLRWRLLLRQVGCDAPLSELYLTTLIFLGLAAITPMNIGEALKVEWLRKRGGLARLEGYCSFALERAADLFVVLLFGLAMLPLGLARDDSALALGLGAGLGLLVLSPFVFLLLQRRSGKGPLAPLARLLAQWLTDWRLSLKVLALSFVGWFLILGVWWICLDALAIRLSALELLAFLSFVTLATLVSLIPGGLGISEVTSFMLLTRFGVEIATAQAGALMLRSIGALSVALGIAAYAVSLISPAPGRDLR